MISEQVRCYNILFSSTLRFQVSEYFIVNYVQDSSCVYVEHGLILKQMQVKERFLVLS